MYKYQYLCEWGVSTLTLATIETAVKPLRIQKKKALLNFARISRGQILAQGLHPSMGQPQMYGRRKSHGSLPGVRLETDFRRPNRPSSIQFNRRDGSAKRLWLGA